MPKIDLLVGEDGSLSGFASMYLHALSCYPEAKDEDKRARFMIALAAQISVKSAIAMGEDTLVLPTSWLDVLLDSPPTDKIFSAAATAAGNSWIAGEVILFMVDAAIHHPELEVTPTKALWALQRILKGEETFGGGTVSVGERTVWAAWSRFKSVAHFHAVRQIWLQDKTRENRGDPKEFVGMQHERVLEYLALAEVIRKEATQRNLIRHSETWWPPDSLDLPPAEINFPPLPQPALEVLAQYRPEYAKGAD